VKKRKRYLKRLRIYLLLIYIVSIPAVLSAQELSVSGTSDVLASSSDNTPLWLVANQNGLYNDHAQQALLGTRLDFDYMADNGFAATAALDGKFRIAEEPESVLTEAWLGASYAGLQLRAGLFPMNLGYVGNPELSSGSMAVSNNAVPIPRVSFSTDGFMPVPLIGSIVETDFGISHGWFADERYIQDALLHEKWLYLKLKREDHFAVHAGLVHEVMWGGNGPNTPPVTWDNYWRVFFSRSGGEDASTSDQINAIGNTLGIWDFGLMLPFEEATLDLYYHHFFEGMGGFLRFRNATDGLWGASLDIHTSRLFVPDSLLYERLITKFQSGEYHDLAGVQLGGRDSYYYNGAYKTGWTHFGRPIGTALFLTSGSGEDTRISSNRVDVHHYGIGGRLSERGRYKVLFSRVSHRPSYAPVSEVEPNGNKVQYHLMLEASQSELFSRERWTGSIALAGEIGDLYDEPVIGCTISLTWRFVQLGGDETKE